MGRAWYWSTSTCLLPLTPPTSALASGTDVNPGGAAAGVKCGAAWTSPAIGLLETTACAIAGATSTVAVLLVLVVESTSILGEVPKCRPPDL